LTTGYSDGDFPPIKTSVVSYTIPVIPRQDCQEILEGRNEREREKIEL
jgi:hypothetical protein